MRLFAQFLYSWCWVDIRMALSRIQRTRKRKQVFHTVYISLCDHYPWNLRLSLWKFLVKDTVIYPKSEENIEGFFFFPFFLVWVCPRSSVSCKIYTLDSTSTSKYMPFDVFRVHASEKYCCLEIWPSRF